MNKFEINENDADPELDTGEGEPTEVSPSRTPYSHLNYELTENELAAKGVRKILISEREELKKRNENLEKFKDQYHQKDKEKSVLEEKLTSYSRIEALYSICLSIGSLIIGLSASSYDADTETILYVNLNIIFLSFGVILVIAAIFIRVFLGK